MSKQINTAVVSILAAATQFGQRVESLRAMLDAATLADRDAVTVALRPGVAQFYKIGHAEHGATGKFVTDDETLAATARQSLSRLVRAVYGVPHRETTPVVVKVGKNERAAYAAFLAACGGDAARVAAVVKALKA